MTVKLLTEHHLEFLSLKGGYTGSSESTLVKMPHCWKSHVAAHMDITDLHTCLVYFSTRPLRSVNSDSAQMCGVVRRVSIMAVLLLAALSPQAFLSE